MKKMFCLLFVLILLFSTLPLSAAAAEDVKDLISALPDVDTVKSLSVEEQHQVYTQVQTAYDAYQALPAQEQAALEGSKETFEALFGYFNTLVMPLEEAEEAEPAAEEKAGIPWHYTALILALVTTFLQNRFIFNRKR